MAQNAILARATIGCYHVIVIGTLGPSESATLFLGGLVLVVTGVLVYLMHRSTRPDPKLEFFARLLRFRNTPDGRNQPD